MGEPKGYLTCQGINPSGQGDCEFRIAKKRVDHLLAHGPVHKYFELFSVHEVLKNPKLIYEGLMRAGQEKGLCYVGTPRRHGDGVEYPPPPNMLFIVCTTEDFKIFEWGWEKVDEKEPDYSKNVKQRFGKLKWKT